MPVSLPEYLLARIAEALDSGALVPGGEAAACTAAAASSTAAGFAGQRTAAFAELTPERRSR